MSANKILPLTTLADIAQQARDRGKSVVLCHGAFDLMHAGHIKHLQSAAREGDMLIVTVTADAFINKGPGRPVFNENLRAETLAALSCVHYVGIIHDSTGIDVIEAIKPNAYVKGSDYRHAGDDVTGNIKRERKAVEAGGGKLVLTDDITFSSSKLLNEHFGIFSDHTRDFLRGFREQYTDTDIHGMINAVVGLKVLILGDAIVDEYHYTSSLGQSGKGNVLAVKYESAEQFAGGSLAVANHVSNFVDKASLATVLGGTENHEAFIRSKLNSNISASLFYRDDGPTVLKRRYVDVDMAKLFEVYYFNEQPIPMSTSLAVCDWLEQHLAEFDAVIVADFGNGCIVPEMREILAQKARYLAVNTQINSGNRGYHVINHYPRADFISLNEPELRLAAHDRHSSLEKLAFSVAESIGARQVAVTRGTRGVFVCDMQNDGCVSVPALSTKVVDRVGAGDTFLSLASLCLAASLPTDVAAFVGSAAAALDVQVVCNREAISKIKLLKYISTLLKWA